MMDTGSISTTDQSATPKHRRRWYQYSLRTLMIVVTLFAVACSWFAVKMGQARRQREAAEAIRKHGGEIYYDNDEYDNYGRFYPRAISHSGLYKILGNDLFANVYLVKIRDYPKADLKSITEFSHLKMLWIEGSRIDDDGLEDLRFFTQLKSLCLADADISNSGLKHLKELPQLQELYLQNNAITDDGLKYLQDLSQLQLLSLDKTAITDNGLKTLKKLSHLQTLLLNGTKITDAGLENLKDFGQLTTLGIRQTIISYAAIRDLQKALPNLKIER
jgi:Leucine-rich repeat (LRR) protein